MNNFLNNNYKNFINKFLENGYRVVFDDFDSNKSQKFILKYLKNSFYLSNQEAKILRNFLQLDIKTC